MTNLEWSPQLGHGELRERPAGTRDCWGRVWGCQTWTSFAWVLDPTPATGTDSQRRPEIIGELIFRALNIWWWSWLIEMNIVFTWVVERQIILCSFARSVGWEEKKSMVRWTSWANDKGAGRLALQYQFMMIKKKLVPYIMHLKYYRNRGRQGLLLSFKF